jgi:transcriptional regulator with XRE-family HTH domain
MKLKLSDNIKRFRKGKGMTQENLAELLNISSAAVSKWESNDSYPDITMIIPLARIFEVSIDELMGYDTAKVESEINEVISKYKELYRMGKFDEAKDTIINARKDYPNDYRIMDTYMWFVAGGSADNNPEILNRNHDEFMQICNTLLDNCTEESLRLNTINMKAKLLHAKGDTKGALEILKGFPSWYLSSEQKTEQLFAKDTPEFRFWIRKNMYELLDFASNKVVKTIWYQNDLTVDEKIERACSYAHALSEFSRKQGWEFFSYMASGTYGELCGKLSFLTDRDEDIIRIREMQLESAKAATIAAEKDKVLHDYILEDSGADNYIKWLINYYETNEFGTFKRLRMNPKFIGLLKKYK